MTLYKPSELILFLSESNIKPKKSLSQNFLIDGNIVRKIIQTAKVEPGDIVLEIGPGPGSLTEALLQAQATVIAVEKDTVFAEKLKRFSSLGNLQIHSEDFLKFPLDSLPSEKKIKVIANLPYHITTPILAYLFSNSHLFSSITVMVQKEVGQRMCAKPNTKEYGSLSLFLNFFSTPLYAFSVSHNSFFPKPKIDSAVIHLTINTPRNLDHKAFFIIARKSFTMKRKMLTSSLKEFYSKDVIEKALIKLNLSPNARPSELSCENWIDFYNLLIETKKSF